METVDSAYTILANDLRQMQSNYFIDVPLLITKDIAYGKTINSIISSIGQADPNSTIGLTQRINTITTNAVFTQNITPILNNMNNNIQNVEDTLRSELPQVAWQHGTFTDYIKVDPLKICNRDVYTFRFQTLNSTLDVMKTNLSLLNTADINCNNTQSQLQSQLDSVVNQQNQTNVIINNNAGQYKSNIF